MASVFLSTLITSLALRVHLEKEVLLVKLVPLVCLVDLVLRVLQVLQERKEHL